MGIDEGARAEEPEMLLIQPLKLSHALLRVISITSSSD